MRQLDQSTQLIFPIFAGLLGVKRLPIIIWETLSMGQYLVAITHGRSIEHE